jgi:hypothetical protein
MKRPLREPTVAHIADLAVLTRDSALPSALALASQERPAAFAAQIGRGGRAGLATATGRITRAGRVTSPGPAAPGGHLSPAGLGVIVRAIAAAPGLWEQLVRFQAGHRWYHRLDYGRPHAGYEVWLLSWLPGQQTGFHDHGDAAGAFAVAEGELLERTARVGDTAVTARPVGAGRVRSFGNSYLHDVQNASARPAVSVHAYSPPLSRMRRYEMTASGLALTGVDAAGDGW